MKIDPKILLGRILQKLIDQGYSQVISPEKTYNKFAYLGHTSRKITIGREQGQDTHLYFEKILLAITKYQVTPNDYDLGPSKTREYGIIHVNSPIWSLLHLLKRADYDR